MGVTNNTELMYEGHCAFAISIGKTDIKGGKNILTKEGKTYVFSNAVAKLLFKIMPNTIAKANEAWSKKQQK